MLLRLLCIQFHLLCIKVIIHNLTFCCQAIRYLIQTFSRKKTCEVNQTHHEVAFSESAETLKLKPFVSWYSKYIMHVLAIRSCCNWILYLLDLSYSTSLFFVLSKYSKHLHGWISCLIFYIQITFGIKMKTTSAFQTTMHAY